MGELMEVKNEWESVLDRLGIPHRAKRYVTGVVVLYQTS